MLFRESTEDADSAPCVEIQSEKETRVTSYALDATSGFLWLGRFTFLILWSVATGHGKTPCLIAMQSSTGAG